MITHSLDNVSALVKVWRKTVFPFACFARRNVWRRATCLYDPADTVAVEGRAPAAQTEMVEYRERRQQSYTNLTGRGQQQSRKQGRGKGYGQSFEPH